MVLGRNVDRIYSLFDENGVQRGGVYTVREDVVQITHNLAAGTTVSVEVFVEMDANGDPVWVPFQRGGKSVAITNSNTQFFEVSAGNYRLKPADVAVLDPATDRIHFREIEMSDAEKQAMYNSLYGGVSNPATGATPPPDVDIWYTPMTDTDPVTGTVTAFQRVYARDENGVVTVTDKDYSGNPYTPTGNVAPAGDGTTVPLTKLWVQVLCDDNAGTQTKFQRAYLRDSAGAITTLDLDFTGATYAPAGTITPCGADQADKDVWAQVLCDNNAGVITRFQRVFIRDEDTGAITTVDTDLSGAAYTVTGTVEPCGAQDKDVWSHILCDDNAGVKTKFQRVYVRDESDGTVTTTDLDMAGAAYVPTGTVGACVEDTQRTVVGGAAESGAMLTLAPPAGANYAEFQVKNKDGILFRTDGGAPDNAANLGRWANKGAVVELESADEIAKFQAVALKSGDAEVYVEYYQLVPSHVE